MSEDINLKKDRNARYPAVDLEQALEFSKMLMEAYRGAVFGRENASQGIGYPTLSGTSGMKVAALVHFGLLDRQGNAYQNSALAKRIYHFSDEEDKKQAIQLAALSPKLFSRLYNQFRGQAMPARLGSILIREYDINQKVAEQVAENFKKSLELAGLAENGVILSEPSQSSWGNDEPTVVSASVKVASSNTQHTVPSSVAMSQAPAIDSRGLTSFELPDTGITVLYPTELGYMFALGKFGPQLSAFAEAVKKAVDEKREVESKSVLQSTISEPESTSEED